MVRFRLLTRIVALGLATVILVASSPQDAEAAVGASAGSAFCGTYDILISFPAMSPDPIPVSSGVAIIGGQTVAQKVAFRANLAQWDGYRWVTIREGTWFTQMAGTMFDQTGFAASSWTTISGWTISGLPGFWNLPSGTFAAPIYYAVWYEYYWYADQYRNARSSSSWAASHEENRGGAEGTAFYDQTYYGYCKYPGPNWLTNMS